MRDECRILRVEKQTYSIVTGEVYDDFQSIDGKYGFQFINGINHGFSRRYGCGIESR